MKRNGAATAIVLCTVVATLVVLCLPGLHRPEVIVTFLIVIALSVAGILYDPLPYSLCQFFSLFCLIFMGVMPMALYISGFVAWGYLAFPTQAYVATNVLIICCQAVFLACAYYKRPRRAPEPALPSDGFTLNRRATWYIAGVAIASALFILFYYRHNLLALVMRTDSFKEFYEKSAMEILICDNLMRSLPAICLAVALMARRAPRWLFVTLIACILVTCMPTSMPRNRLAALFMPILVILFPLLRRRKALTLTIILLLATVFPILNLGRMHHYASIYNGSDFDSYQNLLTVLDIDYVTYGKQLLGVVLFFVPRAIWPGKPPGSGYALAGQLHLSYGNISMPIFGEGYINFGIIGAIAFTVAVALIFRRLDARFCFARNNLYTLIYLIILGDCLFLLRGALMHSFASLCCYILAALIVYVPARRLCDPPEKSEP